MKIKVLFDILKKQGWALDRVRGSHHVFVHEKAQRSLVVPVHSKELPDFYTKSILKQAHQALKKK